MQELMWLQVLMTPDEQYVVFAAMPVVRYICQDFYSVFAY
jgi:hypothetical protein